MAGRREDPSATYTFQGEKGAINISLRALEDYITKRFSGRHLVNSIKTRIGTSRDRKKLRVHASISIWSEQNIRVAGETVQEEITRCLRDGLGLDNVELVKVSVDRIISGKSAKSGPPPAVVDDVG
jgi:ADP-dependent phosphofructokinase/glucokinase